MSTRTPSENDRGLRFTDLAHPAAAAAAAGLDSTSALRILTALKALTTPAAGRRATTVITTIHQPSSQLYHMFDDVILLAKGGTQLYCGKASEARGWWEAKGLSCPEGWNPADCASFSRCPDASAHDSYSHGSQSFSTWRAIHRRRSSRRCGRL